MPRGAQDQRCYPEHWLCKDTLPLSARQDVVVFQTPPLQEDVEVTGRLVVKLWASSNAPDTDFTAKLIDVYPPSRDYPAGVDLNIGDSIVRARYRESLKTAKLLDGDARRSSPSRCIRRRWCSSAVTASALDISSSNFPRFDVNPNTGEPLNQNRRWRIAENSVYHDAQHPSRIILPIIPSRTTSQYWGLARSGPKQRSFCEPALARWPAARPALQKLPRFEPDRARPRRKGALDANEVSSSS